VHDLLFHFRKCMHQLLLISDILSLLQIIRYNVLYEDQNGFAFATLTSSGFIAILFIFGLAIFRRRV
jgi:hypothetical protein